MGDAGCVFTLEVGEGAGLGGFFGAPFLGGFADLGVGEVAGGDEEGGHFDGEGWEAGVEVEGWGLRVRRIMVKGSAGGLFRARERAGCAPSYISSPSSCCSA